MNSMNKILRLLSFWDLFYCAVVIHSRLPSVRENCGLMIMGNISMPMAAE